MNKYHGIGHSPSGFFVYHVFATRLEPKQRPDLWPEEDGNVLNNSENVNDHDNDKQHTAYA